MVLNGKPDHLAVAYQTDFPMIVRRSEGLIS